MDKYKYLGVISDERFKFDEHINYLQGRLKACSYAIYHLQSKTNQKILVMIFNALVQSIVRYGISIYGNTTKTHLRTVENIQARILKTIYKKYKTVGTQLTKRELYKKFNILPMTQLFKYTIILKYYEDIQYKEPTEHDIITRQITNTTYQVPRINNDYGRQTLKYTIPKTFNEVPQILRHINNMTDRKRRIKDWLLQEIDE